MLKRTAFVAVMVALTIASPAAAGVVPYYGFNYLSPTLPSNQCAPYQGRACSGYNNWTESRIAKNSGDVIRLGFQDTGSGFYFLDFGSSYNGTEIQLTRGAVGAPSYQRCYCKYQSGNSSYVQCKAYIP
jgi:hypothetical protein